MLGAITLDETGGGVAAASRLMWRAIQDRWNGTARLITLRRDVDGTEAVRSKPVSRVHFATRLAATQMLGCEGLVFSHLGLARVQRYLPVPIRRPYAVFLHGIEAWRTTTSADRRLLCNAALLVANSSHTARRVVETHGLAAPIEVCPLALVPSTTRADQAQTDRWRPTIGHRAVLTVGRMVVDERYKGHDQLLEAWPHIKSAMPDARLVFAGTGDDVPRLRAKANSLGLAQDVVFTGFLPTADLEALYASAAIFAMPSRHEGFGLVYLEAMSHRLPCIGSIHDAAGDVIADGTSGFLVDQADVGGIVNRMTLLLRDEEQRKAMGDAGYRRFEQQFTYERFRERFLSLLARKFSPDANGQP